MRAGREGALAVAVTAAWAIGAALATRFGIWLAMGSVALLCATVVGLLDGERLARLLRPRLTEIVAGAAVGGPMAVATHALYPLVASLAPAAARDTARLYAAFGSVPAPLAALLVLPVVASEELVWRGLVQTLLARRLGPVGAVGWGALVYAAAHAPAGSPVLVAAAAGCGLVWGALRARTAGLVAPFVAHLVWDALLLFAWPL